MVFFDIEHVEKLALNNHISYLLSKYHVLEFFDLNFLFHTELFRVSQWIQFYLKNAIISVTIYNDRAGKSFWPILIFQLMKLFVLFKSTHF